MADELDNTIEQEPADQAAGRVIGMVVFLAGIVLLVFAFILAYRSFNTIETLIPAQVLTAAKTTTPSAVYLQATLKLVLIIIMGYFGSLIAARGAQFFFSARKEVKRVVPGS